ncbi:NUDIX hydrolase [Desulforhopalus singaporensis]|nr:NUDIX hydrolase [Desulforhopalus singaporensis]
MTTRNNTEGWRESQPQALIQTSVGNLLTSRVTCSRSGKEKNFYRFDFPAWVNIVALTPEQKILMIRQYRFGSGKMEWEIPGGAVEDGEQPLAAGLRELLEETGYEGENGRIIGSVCPNPALQNNSCYTVLVENVQRISPQNLDEMEDISVEPMAIDEVMNMVKQGTLTHGLVLNGLLFYFMTHRPDIFF